MPIAICKGDIRIAKAESSESGHVDVLTELRRVGDYQLRDGDGIVFDEGLVVKADLCGVVLPFGLLCWDVFFSDELWTGGCNL